MPVLPLRTAGGPDGSGPQARDVDRLIIAGWTGRDREAMEAHIRELEALGVRRPATTPVYYRASAALLTTEGRIEVLGTASSGEAEAVVFVFDDGLWLGVGSDHTDREVETYRISVSKQMCAKPIGPDLWPLDDVADHWDELILRSWAVDDDGRRPYQEGRCATMTHPHDLLAGYGEVGAGTAMFCGTHPVIGEIRHASAFELELEDPVLGRRLSHRYEVESLPIVG